MKMTRDLACLALYSLAVFTSLTLQARSAVPTKVWVEESGVVIIEAESVDSTLKPGVWELAVEPSGFARTGYLRFLLTGNTYKDPLVYDAMFDPDRTLIYRVLIKNPGEYSVHLRNHHLRSDGDNDVWVSINCGMAEKVWDHDVERFSWTVVCPRNKTRPTSEQEIDQAGEKNAPRPLSPHFHRSSRPAVQNIERLTSSRKAGFRKA